MKTLLVELNEFNEELFCEATARLNLKNLKRILSFHKSETWTDDTYESGSLEPWVQWVSVHTGVPYAKHQVKHLGDIPQCDVPQLWEKLSEQGVSSGIWGAMNARRAQAKNCLFFLPDPWTASEIAFPEELNTLLMPLRHTSKNYTNKLALLRPIWNLKSYLIKETLPLVKNAIRYRAKPFVFISFFDALSTRLFLQYRRRFNPDFSLIFLNSIAHLQHHQWKFPLSPQDPLAHGFRTMDQIFGQIFAQMSPDDILIVTNALSQKNTFDEKPWILYRQIDPKKFLQTIGIQDAIVEAHMTHDAHLFFPSAVSAQRAKKILESAQIEGKSLFYLETYPDEPCKLFYRIQFTDELPKETYFQIFDKRFRFFDLFTAIVKRTGRHMQKGTLFCSVPYFPSRLANHEISQQILQNCQRKDPLTPQSR